MTGEIDARELGTDVVLLLLHHPEDTAERIATLDALHAGDIVLELVGEEVAPNV